MSDLRTWTFSRLHGDCGYTGIDCILTVSQCDGVQRACFRGRGSLGTGARSRGGVRGVVSIKTRGQLG